MSRESIPAAGRVLCARCRRRLQNVFMVSGAPFGRKCVEIVELELLLERMLSDR